MKQTISFYTKEPIVYNRFVKKIKLSLIGEEPNFMETEMLFMELLSTHNTNKLTKCNIKYQIYNTIAEYLKYAVSPKELQIITASHTTMRSLLSNFIEEYQYYAICLSDNLAKLAYISSVSASDLYVVLNGIRASMLQMHIKVLRYQIHNDNLITILTPPNRCKTFLQTPKDSWYDQVLTEMTESFTRHRFDELLAYNPVTDLSTVLLVYSQFCEIISEDYVEHVTSDNKIAVTFYTAFFDAFDKDIKDILTVSKKLPPMIQDYPMVNELLIMQSYLYELIGASAFFEGKYLEYLMDIFSSSVKASPVIVLQYLEKNNIISREIVLTKTAGESVTKHDQVTLTARNKMALKKALAAFHV